MDGQLELRWLRRATAVAAVARKNQLEPDIKPIKQPRGPGPHMGKNYCIHVSLVVY